MKTKPPINLFNFMVWKIIEIKKVIDRTVTSWLGMDGG